ncbi:MAG: PAS domain-containing protein [Bauldia sp.]|uniref:sensor histidine kinase n=1 Tax=Bauldia sp. TaxID=2575872 RepID=UPI001D41D9DD|nr:ATP-binding protein [Bauldia sp.]MCB1495486.1 PAS domain-containing protein [Bauldia sp.]
MNGKTHAFLDLSAVPAVGAVLLDPRPAFVFRGDGSGILWANAAGAAFFGEDRMGGLLERRFAPSSPTARSLARLAKALPLDHQRIEILRFNFGVRQVALPSACQRLDLGNGARGVLAVGSIGASRESLSTRSERLADAIAADDCLVAVLDAGARVLGASGGFDVLAPESQAIDRLVDEAGRGRHPVVRTRLVVDGGSRPAGVARVTVGSDDIFLLIVGPEEVRPPVSAPAQAAAHPSSPRPPAPVAAPPPFVDGQQEGVPEAVLAPADGTTVRPVAEAVSPVAEAPVEAAPVAAPPPRMSPTRRFLWRSDADGAFLFVSGALAADVGGSNAPAIGETWRDLAARLPLDGDGALADALAGLARFGVTIRWPLAGEPEAVAVDLTGIPDFSRDGVFQGYRGFGVIRLDDRRPVEAPSIPEVPAPSDEAAGEPVAVPGQPADVVEEAPAPAAATRQPPNCDLDEFARQSIEGGGETDRPEPVEPAPDLPAEAARPSEPGRAAEASPQAGREEPRESNVVHLGKTPTRILPKRLSGSEQDAFRRIAEALGVEEEAPAPEPAPDADDRRKVPRPAAADVETPLLNKLPVGIAIYRDARTLFANRTLLDLLGYASLDAFLAAGGAEAIFPDSRDWSVGTLSGGMLRAARGDGSDVAVDAKLHAVTWAGSTALMLSLVEAAPEPAPVEVAAKPPAEPPAQVEVEPRIRELEAMLDTATDGVVVIDSESRVERMNRAAEALFGVEAGEVAGQPFTELLAEESRKPARDYLDGLASNGVASVLNDGREVIGRVPRGGLIPMFMTIGRLTDSGRYCAVLRDITHWKNVEEELVAARHAAEAANVQKSEFLARISHEIRTPLNAIIGFSEVMMAERFGPVGNERYRSYLKDIHLSGEHLMSLINDLLDLSKVEAGKLDLNFESVAVNAVIQECVALMQPQANRERIIIRTSLSSTLPNVVADLRSLRQILLNLLSNAIKFTKAGGQVIVATAMEDSGEVVIRIRDTGIGMDEKDIETAMKPFRQVATSGRTGEGTGLGLPLTKALVEANRASFAIDSVPAQGTLVRITFPTTRVLAG